MTDMQDRYSRMARLNNGARPVTPVGEPPREGNVLASLTLVVVGMVVGGVLFAAVRSCDRPAVAATAPDCSRCHSADLQRKQRLAAYFSRAGSQTPDQMAEAVLATSQPRLLAAVSVVESNGNPHIRRGGYRGRHAGAWQINPAVHGPVPSDPVAQARQAERLLAELTGELPLRRALSVYGGDSSSRYARTVLAELVRVP